MKKNRIALILAGVVIFSSLSINSVNVSAKTESEIKKEIEANNSKIKNLEKEKNKVNAKKSEENDKLDVLRERLYVKNTKLNEMQDKVNKVKNEMADLQSSIDKLNKNIEKVNKEIEEKEKDLEFKKEILGKRLRGMYKSNLESNMLASLINSDSIGDLISSFFNMSMIVKTDNELIEEIIEIQAQLAQKETELLTQKEEAEASKNKLSTVKDEYDVIVKSYQSEVDELKELENERLAIINSLNDEQRAIQREIAMYEEDNADLKNYFNNTSSSGGQTPSTSGFIRPASGGITSPYGPRVHPITGKNSVHTGVDLGSGYGSPFRATKAGVVTSATYHTAYGNMVIIDHGNGVTSLYAHASKLNVSVGQKVNQGDIVSYIGSTGYSTGPHAHFEIRINGQHVNPMNYIQ